MRQALIAIAVLACWLTLSGLAGALTS